MQASIERSRGRLRSAIIANKKRSQSAGPPLSLQLHQSYFGVVVPVLVLLPFLLFLPPLWPFLALVLVVAVLA